MTEMQSIEAPSLVCMCKLYGTLEAVQNVPRYITTNELLSILGPSGW